MRGLNRKCSFLKADRLEIGFHSSWAGWENMILLFCFLGQVLPNSIGNPKDFHCSPCRQYLFWGLLAEFSAQRTSRNGFNINWNLNIVCVVCLQRQFEQHEIFPVIPCPPLGLTWWPCWAPLSGLSLLAFWSWWSWKTSWSNWAWRTNLSWQSWKHPDRKWVRD